MSEAIDFLSALWWFPPVRWAVFLGLALVVAYIAYARVNRWVYKDGHVSLFEKCVLWPFRIVLGALSLSFNWTVAVLIWWDSGPAWPPKAWDFFTNRLQRTLDHPVNYPYRAVALARYLKPRMNRYLKAHLQ